MKITIVTVGKVKETYFVDAIKEYSKRLSRYCKLEIVEVSDEKTPDHASEKEEEMIRRKEGERLRHYLREGAYLIALDIAGTAYTSEGLSKRMQWLGVQGESHIIFVIGGSIGLEPSILKEANERISFSAMTFPHQLMRVILLEQIYRAYRIMKGEPYHK